MFKWDEKDVEDYLYQHPDKFKMFLDTKVTWVARQYSLPSGVLDLLGKTEQEMYFVLEIKNVPLSSSAVAQVCRYASDVEVILNRANVYNAQIYPVRKYLLFPEYCINDVPQKVLHEANALNVIMKTFTVDFGLCVGNGHVQWNENKKQEIEKQIDKCAEDQIFQISKRLPEMEVETQEE